MGWGCFSLYTAPLMSAWVVLTLIMIAFGVVMERPWKGCEAACQPISAAETTVVACKTACYVTAPKRLVC